MSEKKTETETKVDVTDKDVKEMAELFIQLESLFSAQDMKVKPTSEDIQKMAVSLYIHRGDMKAYAPAQAAAPAVDNTPKRTCPGCQTVIPVAYSKGTGRPYYKCKKCNCWVNDDGSTTPCKDRKT